MNFRSIFTRKANTGNIATQRLKLILTQDRFDVSDDSMQKLQVELTEVLAKYFEFTMHSVKMSLKRDGNSYVLMADFPFKNSKKRR
ncbi:MAG: cell division topological specificity factor MinE [Candidatus Poribacteria bacterium]|nr:cell division topological specificity factor MinE [Candidatus Poribacteria bacterium]